MKFAPLVLAAVSSVIALAVPAAAANSDGGSLVCLSPHFIKETKIVSDSEILIYMRDGKIWQNLLPARCPGLRLEGGFRWDIRGDEVCSNLQAITVLRRGNTCLLGAFTAYTPPDKPAPAQQPAQQ